MLKSLALVLLVATFIASGFSLAPVAEMPAGGRRTVALETQALANAPAASHLTWNSGSARLLKRDREPLPSS